MYELYPDRIFHIVAHYPWNSKEKEGDLVYPAGGKIDAAFAALGDKPAGFDVKGSPFGKLTDTQSTYSAGYEPFTLDKFCDGYIFLNSLAKIKPVRCDYKYATEKTIAKIRLGYPAGPERRDGLTVKEFYRGSCNTRADLFRNLK